MRIKNKWSAVKFLLVVLAATLAPFFIAGIIAFVQSNTIEESLPSVLNFDTGENNQYRIEGLVKSLPYGINPGNVFINLYQQRRYRFRGFQFRRWIFMGTVSLNPDSGFSFKSLGAGTYKLVPLSNWSESIYFTESYVISVNGHNPEAVILKPPISSLWDFLVRFASRIPFSSFP